MSRKRMTKTQKAKKQAEYKQIRKAWKKLVAEQEREGIIDTTTYKGFKNRVLAKQMVGSYNIRTAIRKTIMSEAYTPPAERSRANLLEAIKENFNDVYKQIQQLARDEKGRYKNLIKAMTWEKHNGKFGYTFTNARGVKYFIDVTNSPEQVLIYAVQD